MRASQTAANVEHPLVSLRLAISAESKIANMLIPSRNRASVVSGTNIGHNGCTSAVDEQ
jgi:hypothetical protein